MLAAAQSGDQVLVRLLLERNANPNSASARGSQRARSDRRKVRAARDRCAAHRRPSLRGARVERTGNRALHLAALSGSVQMVELLLERRADPCAVNAHGQTAWSYAQNALSKRKVCTLPTGRHREARPAEVEQALGAAIREKLRVGEVRTYPEPALAHLRVLGRLREDQGASQRTRRFKLARS